VLLDERQMLGESLPAVDAVFRAANRPVEDEAQCDTWISDAKRQDRAASHAATHQVRALDVEMVQQSFALRDVVTPRNSFDTASRLTAFTPVENDACKFFREIIENLDFCVDTLRRPLLQSCVESRRRVHQERRSGANHFVSCLNAIDDCSRQANSSIKPAHHP